MIAQDGVLAYRTQPHPPFAAHAFRIVHVTCHSVGDTELCTVGLAACLDRDGLSLLLAFLSAGPGRRDEPGLTVHDIDEFVDVVRRLHVPLYEPARARFGDPAVRAALRHSDRAGPYQSPALRRLLRDPVGTAGQP